MSVRDIITGAAGVSTGPVQGQVVYTANSTVVFTVPAGVTSICILCVQEGGSANAGVSISAPGYAYVRNSSLTTVCRAQNGARIGDGGGDGGIGGGPAGTSGPGGGGAGGYSGNGGNGSASSAGTAGSGGGGGGGGIGTSGGSFSIGWGGGGVGLLGQGSNGGLGATGAGGGGGSGGQTGTQDIQVLYGGGYRGAYFSGETYHGGRGGALAYKNNIACSPGDVFYASPYGFDNASNGLNNAAIRIIWGPGRSFPSTNTGNV